MRKFYKLLIAFVLVGSFSKAQVTVSGGSTATYSNVNAAFAAINAGTHFGAITISVTANTIEGVTGYLPTPLLASGQGPANYTSIVLRPTATATISGDVATGRGVLELDGVDNFIINGDIIGGPIQKDLTISCDAANTVAATAAIRFIGRTTLGLGATNNTITNCKVIGNTEGNDGVSGSTVVNSYGIYAGANTLNLTTAGLGDNYDNITISNNEITRAYFGIWIGSTTLNPGDNNLISGNKIGSNTAGQTITFGGVHVSTLNTSTITLNEVFKLKTTTSVSNAGIQLAGTSNSITVSRNKVYEIYNLSTGGWGAYGINLIGGNNHLVVNNVVYDVLTVNYSSTSTTWNAFGIRITTGTGHKIYYNSVNLFGQVNQTTASATSVCSAAFLVTSTAVTGIEVRNNIFNNTQTSTLSAVTVKKFMSVWFPTSYNFLNATINNNGYNILNDADHFVGKVGTTNNVNEASTLAAWQLFSQVNNALNDVNSIPVANTAAPFTSNTNLTIPLNTNYAGESGGVLIPALGTNIDYNASVRPLAGINPNTNPDMGAYEFDGVNGVPNDAGINTLVSPAANGCYGASENVIVAIKNYGTNSITNIPVTLTIAGPINQTLTGTYTGTIIPTGTFNYTLGTINMSAAGIYTFNAFTTLAGDVTTNNDAMAQTIRTVIAPSPLPQSIGFTGYTGANLPTFFPLWTEATGSVVPTGTTSSWTSQNALNGATNVNARVFLSAIAANEWIVGPKVTATTTTQISFDAALTLNTVNPFAPATMGSDDRIRVMVSTDCGVTFAPIFTINATNNLGTNFTNFTVPLGAYAGQNIIVAFLAQDGPVDDVETYYFQLDNINLYNASATDAGISAIVSPTLNACLGTAEPIIVTVNNFGTASISNFSVTANINGPINTTLVANYTGTLAANASANFTIGTANMNLAGIYNVTAFTNLGGDPNAFNNTSVVTRTQSPAFGISGNTSICTSGTASLSLIGAAVSYTWSTGSNANAITVTPSVTTTYSAIGTGTNGCQVSAFSTVTVSNPTITGLGAAVCGTNAVGTLTANGFAPVTWYATPTPTNPLATGNTFTATAATTTTYYAQAISNNTSSIATTYSAGNGSNGNMFDVTALNPITINSVDVVISSVAVSTVEVWYRFGSFVGFESSNTGWTSAGTGTVMGAGNGNPVPLNVNLGINIPGGQTYGIYVTSNGGATFGYSNGTAVGNLFSQNSDLSVFEGKGGSYFGVTISTRIWNGNIHYTKQGCSSPIIPVTLTVTPSPAITLVASQTSVCPSNSVSIGATGANTYTWSTGANGALVSVTPTASTVYTVSGETTPGCIGTSSIAITTNSVPVVNIASSASLICAGQSVNLTASGASSYVWNTAATTTVISVTPSVTTSYTVTGTAPNTCSIATVYTQSVSTCTGVDANTTFSNLISIYPNPSNGIITAEFGFYGEKEILITNSVGQLIKVIKTKNSSEVIDLDQYAKGIYYVKIMSNENSSNYRIIIQ